nr:O-phosphoseryl-tRNA(Sec) selenium transferase [Candidatus Sigynarchaeota archaeon]
MFKDLLREKLKDLMDKGILERGLIVLDDLLDPIKQVLDQRSIPDAGWNEKQLRLFFDLLSSMDTDKDESAARVGEREGRTVNDYVLSLSAGFAHGIGRSGDIMAVQPKAAGGSILNLLSGKIATSLLKKIGLPKIGDAIVLPMATGMSLGLCMATIHQEWEKVSPGDPWKRSEVIIPRVDHKSPIKGIKLAGFTPIIIPSIINGDAVEVPFERIKEAITEKTAAILSTTAFFPPRLPDNVKNIAKLCKDLSIPHVINNSYGMQSETYLKVLRGGIDAGRIDYIVQSTDKNFLTPVGGAVICSPSIEKMEVLSQTYAGRASAQPLVQFLAAVLSLGLSGYRKLMEEQKANRQYLQEKVGEFASKIGQRLLEIENPIATAMTLNGLTRDVGGMLYNLRVTGPRVVFPGEYGSCIDRYPVPYMTLNAGIGARRADFEMLIERLNKLAHQLGRTS